MSEAILLDSGPLGKLVSRNKKPDTLACHAWFYKLLGENRRLIVPEIADYEVRRSLLKIDSATSIKRLDELIDRIEYLPLTTLVMRRAAELWAEARKSGSPAAPDPALDGDMILIAQAQLLGVPYVIATENISHLSLFASATRWKDIS